MRAVHWSGVGGWWVWVGEGDREERVGRDCGWGRQKYEQTENERVCVCVWGGGGGGGREQRRLCSLILFSTSRFFLP